jgi:hypothetical protein
MMKLETKILFTGGIGRDKGTKGLYFIVSLAYGDVVDLASKE